MKKLLLATLVVTLVALCSGLLSGQQQNLKPTTPRLRTITYEQSLDGSRTYTLIQDSMAGGGCWWEIMVIDNSNAAIYAVPVSATACVP